MIRGSRVNLRQFRDEDWHLLEKWAQSREALWGAYQRYQLDVLPELHQYYQQTGLLSRESSFLIIETVDDAQAVGFIRYTLIKFPDSDFPHPEIGFGIGELSARKKGLAKEAIGLLVNYLFAGYDAERITAITDSENITSQRLLEKLGFYREGVMRQASFRDGGWRDMAIYGLLRGEWKKPT
jgi:RimJ/RimL family protein N-acetyltransferase